MASSKKQPKWLYETLPYVYIVGGIATAAILQHVIATISGLLLLSAGALVLTMRHNYRTSRQAPAAAPLREAQERNSDEGAGLLQIGWRPAFEVGHDVIDRQHRHLTALGNEIITALIQRRPREDVDLMLDVLVTEIGKHLQLEASLAAGQGATPARSVAESHRSLLARATDLRDRHQCGALLPGDLVGFIAYDLVAMHVVKEDVRLARPQSGRPPTGAAAHARRSPAETVDSA
jgi:hemerythrin-like metal-binding protein